MAQKKKLFFNIQIVSLIIESLLLCTFAVAGDDKRTLAQRD